MVRQWLKVLCPKQDRDLANGFFASEAHGLLQVASRRRRRCSCSSSEPEKRDTGREVSSSPVLHPQIWRDRSLRPPFQRIQKLLDSQHRKDYGLCSEIRNLVNFGSSHLSFPVVLRSKYLKVKQISYDDFGGLQESEISEVNASLYRQL